MVLLVITFVVFGTTVSTHLGEFWPFSIYPMFSSAGNPWTRAIVQEVGADETAALAWQPVAASGLPGETLPLTRHGISQNDLSDLLGRTSQWTDRHTRTVASMFDRVELDGSHLIVYRVGGTLHSSGVDIIAVPWILIRPGDSVEFLPARLEDLP